MTKWKYGDGWEQFPIEPGEVWGIPTNGSKVVVHNIFDPLPAFMFQADLLFVDPPWNVGNLNSFYTKAGREDYQDSFTPFTDVLFRRIREIAPTTCYIEIGNQYVEEWRGRLSKLFPVVQHWTVVYYRKHPTNIIRGSAAATTHDFTGMDEAKVIAQVGKVEPYTIMGDLCMGQGLVGLSAYDAGKPFVGTELNKRRLANLLKKLTKRGAQVSRY
ncbi:MAG: hypothetical protein E6R03_14505 [Hyphomicrobiaceae bacterium]|nr:MAG: hypothetical protein E6R03_14505 [Hyphomicrobiaceae bacterium]